MRFCCPGCTVVHSMRAIVSEEDHNEGSVRWDNGWRSWEGSWGGGKKSKAFVLYIQKCHLEVSCLLAWSWGEGEKRGESDNKVEN